MGLIERVRKLWRERIKSTLEAWGDIEGVQSLFRFVLDWAPRLISVVLIIAAIVTYALGLLILVWVFLLFGVGLAIAVVSWFFRREVHVHHVGLKGSVTAKVIRAPATPHTFGQKVAPATHTISVAREPDKNRSSKGKQRKRNLQVISSSSYLTILDGAVQIRCSIWPRETTTAICKVQRPDGKVDQLTRKPAVGLSTDLAVVYPDDFQDAPPLIEGAYSFAWTKGKYEPKRGLSLATITSDSHEFIEESITSGGFEVH